MSASTARANSFDLAAGRPLPERSLAFVLMALLGLVGFLLQQTSVLAVVRELKLPDTDDMMRLAAVRDLVAGQGWFDNVQHRYLPPSGAAMHWSRLVDLPLAGLIFGLTPILGSRLAEGVVAALWPPALFLAYLAVIFIGTRRLFGARAACFAVFEGSQLALSALFDVGRIDHHNVQILTITIVALNIATPGPRLVNAVAAGTLSAFSLAVGLETLPFVAVLGTVMVLAWVVEGGARSRLLAGFGAALALAGLAFFCVQTAPSLWFVAECDALSPPWLLLAGGAGMGSVLLAASTSRLGGWRARLAAAAALGAVLVGADAFAFPQCLTGPFAGLPEAARTGWLDQVIEVMPLWRVAMARPADALGIALPFGAALVAAVFGIARGPARLRFAFVVSAAYLGVGFLITIVHVRGFFVGSALVPVLAGWVFDRALSRLADRPGEGPRSLLVRVGPLAASLLLLTRLSGPPVTFVQQALGAGPDGLASLLATGDCADPERLASLNRLPPGLVLAPIDLGPSLLVQTHHQIVAAPYHRNGEAILAGLAVLSGSESELRDAVRRYRPDYILVCRGWVAGGSSADGFAAHLVQGAGAAWLKPVPPSAGDLSVWRVLPEVK